MRAVRTWPVGELPAARRLAQAGVPRLSALPGPPRSEGPGGSIALTVETFLDAVARFDAAERATEGEAWAADDEEPSAEHPILDAVLVTLGVPRDEPRPSESTSQPSMAGVWLAAFAPPVEAPPEPRSEPGPAPEALEAVPGEVLATLLQLGLGPGPGPAASDAPVTGPSAEPRHAATDAPASERAMARDAIAHEVPTAPSRDATPASEPSRAIPVDARTTTDVAAAGRTLDRSTADLATATSERGPVTVDARTTADAVDARTTADVAASAAASERGPSRAITHARVADVAAPVSGRAAPAGAFAHGLPARGRRAAAEAPGIDAPLRDRAPAGIAEASRKHATEPMATLTDPSSHTTLRAEAPADSSTAATREPRASGEPPADARPRSSAPTEAPARPQPSDAVDAARARHVQDGAPAPTGEWSSPALSALEPADVLHIVRGEAPSLPAPAEVPPRDASPDRWAVREGYLAAGAPEDRASIELHHPTLGALTLELAGETRRRLSVELGAPSLTAAIALRGAEEELRRDLAAAGTELGRFRVTTRRASTPEDAGARGTWQPRPGHERRRI